MNPSVLQFLIQTIICLFRPVIAILEIDIMKVNEAKRDHIYHDVVCNQGPPDGTVILSLVFQAATVEFDDDAINEILDKLAREGEAVLVRYVCGIWVIIMIAVFIYPTHSVLSSFNHFTLKWTDCTFHTS